jgi:hypothetical protein
VELDVLSNGTINMPCDFMDVLNLGVMVGNDFCLMTSATGKVPILRKDDCGVEQPSSTTEIVTGYSHTSPSTHTRNGENSGGYFGHGGGINPIGTYIVDNENQRILLSFTSSYSSKVVLHYSSDPALIDGEFLVHSYDVEAVKAYIRWQDIYMKRGVPMGEKEMFRVEWKRAKMMAKRRHKSFSIADALEVLRRHQKQSPRL